MAPNNPNEPPFMMWFEADFQLSTAAWPEPAKVIYRVLLQTAWHRRALPSSEAVLAKLCGMKLSTFLKYWNSHVKEKFPRARGSGGYQNPRVKRDRNKVKLNSLKNKKYGSVGGRKSAEMRKANAEAARKKEIDEIHTKGRDAEPVTTADLDPSKIVGRK